MQTLVVRKIIPHDIYIVWQTISNLENFAKGTIPDPETIFIGLQRSGVGTQISFKQPIFPFFPALSKYVLCTVTTWSAFTHLEIKEEDDNGHLLHIYDFFLIPTDDGRTIFQFTLYHHGIPHIFLPCYLWIIRLLRIKMEEKLLTIEKDCAYLTAT